jgi:pilus assembly protein CpaB
MGPRRLSILALAVLVAGGTALFAKNWINDQRPAPVTVVAAPPPVEKGTEILVARLNLPAGRFIKENEIEWREWPSDDVPDSYFVKGERTMQEVADAVVRRGIAAGEPIIDGGVVKPGDRGFLAAVLSPGMRAVSVPINATSGNSGLIFPGDRVDLILTQTLDLEGNDSTRRVSETVLEDIRIIAMGVDVNDDAKGDKNHEKARTATLEVTPRQAESVTLVTELGKLSLSLRSLAADSDTDVQVPDGWPRRWWSSRPGTRTCPASSAPATG